MADDVFATDFCSLFVNKGVYLPVKGTKQSR